MMASGEVPDFDALPDAVRWAFAQELEVGAMAPMMDLWQPWWLPDAPLADLTPAPPDLPLISELSRLPPAPGVLVSLVEVVAAAAAALRKYNGELMFADGEWRQVVDLLATVAPTAFGREPPPALVSPASADALALAATAALVAAGPRIHTAAGFDMFIVLRDVAALFDAGTRGRDQGDEVEGRLRARLDRLLAQVETWWRRARKAAKAERAQGTKAVLKAAERKVYYIRCWLGDGGASAAAAARLDRAAEIALARLKLAEEPAG